MLSLGLKVLDTHTFRGSKGHRRLSSLIRKCLGQIEALIEVFFDKSRPIHLKMNKLRGYKVNWPAWGGEKDIMQTYLDLLNKVLTQGVERTDRTNTGTKSLFGYQMRFDLQKGFPLLTTKKVYFRSLAYELLWFLKGDTNIQYLKDKQVHIWDAWADKNGDLGRIYGAQWRSWQKPDGNTIDQISQVVQSIKNNPFSRRHLVVAFNPGELDQMALPPCHAFFQFYVAKETLSCQLYQRSADLFLGVPFNIASYSLLTMMVAQVCKLKPGFFIHTFGDVHLYLNHIEQAKEQLKRTPKTLPTLEIKPALTLFDYKYENFKLKNYDPHPAIKAPISV